MPADDITPIALNGTIPEIVAFAAEAGLSPLPALERALTQDRPIAELERFERLLKAVLRTNFARGLSADEAREVAAFQQRVGLLCKYKSYTVKCATPLGYAIFLHEPNEGFSYQRHLDHKVEIFHILDAMPGAFVFICEYADWEDVYEKESFDAWLAGAPDARYERFAYRPSPGDMVRIERLNVVHTVVGCVLEEFASVSTDMVDRLHDQNAGRGIPEKFTRTSTNEKLLTARAPAQTRDVILGGGSPVITPIAPIPITGGQLVVMSRGTLNVSRWIVDAHAETDPVAIGSDAASLHVLAGTGALQIGDTAPLPLQAGDTLMVAPGQTYRFQNDGEEPLVISEQRIAPETALILEGN